MYETDVVLVVGMYLVLQMINDISYQTCRYLPSLCTLTKSHCLATKSYVYKLAQGCCPQI